MGYRAKDGKVLPSVIQGRKYDRYLDEQRVQTQVDRGKQDVNKAPGGAAHEEAFRLHGVAKHIEVDIDGPGRYKVTSTHADGHTYQGIHPQAHVVQDVVGHLVGVNPPMAIETHSKARAHPVGEREGARIAKEDGREDGMARFEDFEGKS